MLRHKASTASKHVKANLSIKRIQLSKLVYWMSLKDIHPSEVVIVDLGCSTCKDYESVMRVGILPENYIGFDVDIGSVEEANRRLGREHAFVADLSAADARRTIRMHMNILRLSFAHIALCNFTLHHFRTNQQLFELIDPSPAVPNAFMMEGCGVMCSILDARNVQQDRVTISNMVQLTIERGGDVPKIISKIIRNDVEEGTGKYAYSGEPERCVYLDEVIRDGLKKNFIAACSAECYNNAKIFDVEIQPYSARMEEEYHVNLSHFLSFHATPVFCHYKL